MKREIKFRAKNKNGEWIVGDIHLQCKTPHIHYVGDKYLIDVDTISQYTGLKDINGKEIYEGDIIKGLDSTKNDILHVVKWDDQTASFEAYLIPFDKHLHKSPLSQNWLDFFDKEVIGNIFDNPELLQKEKEI